jgi:uncharacterized protein (TIGR03437 family)
MKSRGVVIAVSALTYLLFNPLSQSGAQNRKTNAVRSKPVIERRMTDPRLPEQSPADAMMTTRDSQGTLCRQMSAAEYRRFNVENREGAVHPLSHLGGRLSGQAGLKIILRGTSQLEQLPEAKAAFLRAAAIWENIIRDPITVILDVDFGPSFFGRPYSSNVVGSTLLGQLTLRDGYEELRSDKLIAHATDPLQIAVYKALPAGSLPTDIGPAKTVAVASAQLRALGLLPAAADPAVENAQLGPPPSIGFNSNFGFDFDPSDGVDVTKIDFESTAAHEIGHALGFFSSVGAKEFIPTRSNAPSLWDFFRFSPGGLTFSSLSDRPRLQFSRFDHTYFSGDEELELSSSENGRQASHWKDDALGNKFIGVMDPTLNFGLPVYVTAADVRAAQMFGYAVNPETRVFEILSYDDNSNEEFYEKAGPIYLNRFTPSRSPSTIQALRIALALPATPGILYEGLPIRIVAFQDPDRLGRPPANPTLSYDQIQMIPKGAAGGYVEIPLPDPPAISKGDLYVGVQAITDQLPLVGDSNGKQALSSFLSTDNGATFELLRNASGAPVNLRMRAIVSNRYGDPVSPVIATLNPETVPPGTASLALVVEGGGFQTNSVVRLNGADRKTTFISGRELRAEIPATDLAVPSTAKITVATPAIGESSGLDFRISAENPSPFLVRVVPDSAGVGVGDVMVRFYGRNFTSQSVALLDGAALATTFIDSRQLTAIVPSSVTSIGGEQIKKISVQTPGPAGGFSSDLRFTVLPCAFSFRDNGSLISSFGVESGITLYASSPSCPWTAAADQTWIALKNAPMTGAGKAILDFSISPNSDSSPRIGKVNLAGLAYPIRQRGRATAVSAASFRGSQGIAPGSIATLFGGGMATGSQAADSTPLPSRLGGTAVLVGLAPDLPPFGPAAVSLSSLFFTSPGQINLLLPSVLPLNPTPLIVEIDGLEMADALITPVSVSPGLFTASSNGVGVPSAVVLRFKADGSQVYEPLMQFDVAKNQFTPIPIDLGPEGDRVFVLLFGTGIRGRSDLSAVSLKLGEVVASVSYAGPQELFPGLDQVNVELPRALAGRGDVDLNLNVDGIAANVVTVRIK